MDTATVVVMVRVVVRRIKNCSRSLFHLQWCSLAAKSMCFRVHGFCRTCISNFPTTMSMWYFFLWYCHCVFSDRCGCGQKDMAKVYRPLHCRLSVILGPCHVINCCHFLTVPDNKRFSREHARSFRRELSLNLGWPSRYRCQALCQIPRLHGCLSSHIRKPIKLKDTSRFHQSAISAPFGKPSFSCLVSLPISVWGSSAGYLACSSQKDSPHWRSTQRLGAQLLSFNCKKFLQTSSCFFTYWRYRCKSAIPSHNSSSKASL